MKIKNNELLQLPPFKPNQAFKKDELSKIILFGVPMQWQREMEKQNFDPDLHSYRELIDFCERMEATIDSRENDKSENNNNKKGKLTPKSTGNTGGKWCEFHHSHSHNTADCRQKKFHGNPDSAKKPEFHKNKSWHNKANNNQLLTKKEVNAMIKKAINYESEKGARKRVSKEMQLADAENEIQLMDFEVLPNQPLNVSDIVEEDEVAMAATMNLDELDAKLA